MDYGYPQFTEAQILAEFIKTDAYKMEASAANYPLSECATSPFLRPRPPNQPPHEQLPGIVKSPFMPTCTAKQLHCKAATTK